MPLSGILPNGQSDKYDIVFNFTTILKNVALTSDGPPPGASCVAPGKLLPLSAPCVNVASPEPLPRGLLGATA